MSFLAEVRKYVALVAGRIPLAKPHFCPRCRSWTGSLTKRQFADWQQVSRSDPGHAPTIYHHCGAPLQCAGPKPTTITELIGEDR